MEFFYLILSFFLSFLQPHQIRIEIDDIMKIRKNKLRIEFFRQCKFHQIGINYELRSLCGKKITLTVLKRNEMKGKAKFSKFN